MPELTDEILIAEIRGGSKAAFEALMQRHERTVYRIGYSYSHNPEDAMDIVQNVFLRVYERLDSFRGEGAFRSWLLRIVHRQCLNWLRDHRRSAGTEELTVGNEPPVAAAQESELIRRERIDRVLHGLEALNPRQRLAVSLRYFEELPIREIAATLECSEGVTKNILFRSLERLRRRLVLR